MTPLSHNFRLDGEFEILVTSLNLYIKSFAFVYVPVHFFVWYYVLAIHFGYDVTRLQTSPKRYQPSSWD